MPTERQPMTFAEARDSLPLFTIGTTVKIERYVGLLAADHPMVSAVAREFRPLVCRIEEIRLASDVDEEWSEEQQENVRVLTYPKGWEYLVVAPSGSVWGWVKEADLLAKGYQPANPTDLRKAS